MIKMTIKIALLTILLIVVGFFISGPIITNSETKEKIEQLIVEGNKNSGAIDFTSTEFLSLPKIVKKYLKNSISPKSKTYQITHLKLLGETRADRGAKWSTTEVDFHLSLSSPAFVWVASTEQMVFLWDKTINTLINETAVSESKFVSSITTDKTEGVILSQSSFLFYILNSVLSPTVLMPSQNIQWKGMGELKAEVVIWYKSSRGKAIFYFNNLGYVERIETEDMFVPKSVDSKKAKFTVHLANYKNVDGYNVPTYLEYQWNFSDGDFTFSRFNITDIENY